MYYRMKKVGYNFCLGPKIKSKRYARSTFNKLIKQKYLNGYWIGLTMGIQPKCFLLYHFVPFAFVMSVIVILGLAMIEMPVLFYLLAGAYLLCNIVLTITSFVGEKANIYNLLLPVIFFAMHFAYRIGTLIGLIKMPFWIKRISNGGGKLKCILKERK